ncbi:Double zinc ribbon [Clostridium cavendishii DSM 21758]|uniref:Double zinc ribbon n=1 Tax=Clostridium cavendishii DSM 21758 TaxID=1121302 RepID=A0A1M6CLU2_9CLOT|nr:zinc ribbon domain-containing protein [Clostridium cavendishii]SHI61893.1 Double zinc ribbon [Clostridium cavendishii DSM 21758]
MSIWKKIFFIILSIISIFFIGISSLVIINCTKADIIPVCIMGLVVLIVILIIYLIGRFVFTDAKKRGMDPWLWTTIAIFIPNLLGLILYLIIRTSYTKEVCLNCGKAVNEDFLNCPYCGYKLKNDCPSCNSPISPTWNVCPKCGKKLK